MTTTAASIVNDSLMEIGVLAEGDTATATMLDSALRALNRICDKLSNDQSFSPYANHETWALTGESSFTIGPGNTATFTVTLATPAVFTSTAHGLSVGDQITLTTTGALPTGLAIATTYYIISTGFTADAFEVSLTLGGTAVNTSVSQSGVHTFTQTVSAGKLITTRPIKIDTATVDRNGITYPCLVVDNQKWDSIAYKGVVGANTTVVYYESTSPISIIHVWPLATGCTLNLRVINRVLSFPTLSSTLVMPPGYEEACIKLLAVNIAPQYPAGVLSPLTLTAAKSALRYLQKVNNVIPTMQLDSSLTNQFRRGSLANFMGGY